MIARRGLMLVLSSPSGAGKTTLSRKLLEVEKGIEMSVSVTTPRKPARASFFASTSRERNASTSSTGIENDAPEFAGSGYLGTTVFDTEAVPWHDQPFSAALTLPPLGAVLLVPE